MTDDQETRRIADAIANALHRQGKAHSDAADAPTVWEGDDPRFIHIDGAVNVIELARAVLMVARARP